MSDFSLEQQEEKKKMSGREAAELNVNKFLVWLASKVPVVDGKKQYDKETWLPIVNSKTHKLDRTEMASQIGFCVSVLRQNPKINAELEELENELRKEGILPELTESGKAKANTTQKYDQGTSQRHVDAKRLRDLEEENQRLTAKLRRFEELEQIMGELGLGVDL